jgi:hypothetical protein
MRDAIKWAIRLSLLALSIDSLFAIVDNFGRWDWLENAMLSHPAIAVVLRGPLFPLLCLGVALLAVYGKEYLKLPSVMARYINSRTIPNLKSVTVKMLFDTESKAPGWDLQEAEWYWLIEVRLANESETPITVEDIEGRVRVGGNKWIRWFLPAFTRKTLSVKHVKDATQFSSSPHDGQPKYEHLSGLFQNIKGLPLTKGVGHTGWICFLLKANQRELSDHPVMDVWLIDALYGKHRLIYKKDEKNWDKSFDITRD